MLNKYTRYYTAKQTIEKTSYNVKGLSKATILFLNKKNEATKLGYFVLGATGRT